MHALLKNAAKGHENGLRVDKPPASRSAIGAQIGAIAAQKDIWLPMRTGVWQRTTSPALFARRHKEFCCAAWNQPRARAPPSHCAPSTTKRRICACASAITATLCRPCAGKLANASVAHSPSSISSCTRSSCAVRRKTATPASFSTNTTVPALRSSWAHSVNPFRRNGIFRP